MIVQYLFSLFFVLNGSVADWGTLDLTQKEIKLNLKKATLCMPSFEEKSVKFCTGFKLSDSQLKQMMSLNTKDCLSQIKKMGYSSFVDKAPPSLLASDYKSFIESTKTAETFYEEKVVLFKAPVEPLVCIHEHLHLLQHQNQETALSPFQRKKIEIKFQSILEDSVTQIEKLEKSGKRSEALQKSSELQPYIETLKAWVALDDFLDEREVYGFLFRFCKLNQDNKNCTPVMLEYNLANLLKRKKGMPQDWLSEIQSSVDQILKSKRVASMSEIKKSWIQFKNPQLDEVKGYFKSSSQDVLSKIQKLIPIYFLKEMAQSAFIKNAPIGGLDQLPHLPEVKKAEIKNSMIFKGQALGKFYCFTDQKALLLTRQSSLGVLIHEYLHSLQSINNFAYCEALTNQQATEKKFLSGQLSKEVYENQMFKYQTMNAMAEIEVYRILIENPSVFSSEENINNQVVLKEYEKQWF